MQKVTKSTQVGLAILSCRLFELGLDVVLKTISDGRWHQVPAEADELPAGWVQITTHNGYTLANVRPGTGRDQVQILVIGDDIEERWFQGAQFKSEILAQQLEDEQRSVATWVRNMIAKLPVAGIHPYLVRKGVQAHGVKQDWHGNLVLPVRDAAGKIWSRQIISADGEKKLTAGGRVKGCYIPIGNDVPGMPLIIVEGFATGASVREATGLPVVAAINCHNLAPVARALRAKYPHRLIVIAADNDPNGSGQKTAEAAATEVNGISIIPQLPRGCVGTDWNDLAATAGLREVRRQLINAAPHHQHQAA